MKIFCLFSVANMYDQPSHNLEAWWPEKPSLETLAKTLDTTFPGKTDEATLAIVKVWSGENVRWSDTDFRLEELNPGKVG